MIHDNISDELKIYELSLIWKEAEYNFAFWEKLDGTVNWDEEYKKALPRVLATTNLYDYYMELMRFVALLRDGHTNVWFPQFVIENFACLPINFMYIEGKHVITYVDKSLENDVKKYSIIKKINGVDIDEYIEKNIFPYIWHEKYDSCYGQIYYFISIGEENSEVEFEIEDYGINKNVKMKRIKENFNGLNISICPSEKLYELYNSNSHRICKTKDDIAIITIPHFWDEKLPEEFYANQKILENMRGFIIDVRYNGGGNSSYGLEVLKAFVKGEFKGQTAKTQLHIAAYRAMASKFHQEIYSGIKKYLEENAPGEEIEKAIKIYNHIYYEKEENENDIFNGNQFLPTQPLVVLSTNYSGSAAENFLMYVDITKRGTIVGSASNGSTGDQVVKSLESGGWFRICARNVMYPDGRTIADVGVQPHIKCEPTLDDYKNGVDSVMNRGLEEVRKMI